MMELIVPDNHLHKTLHSTGFLFFFLLKEKGKKKNPTIHVSRAEI